MPVRSPAAHCCDYESHISYPFHPYHFHPDIYPNTRIDADRQTDKQKNRQTDRHTDTGTDPETSRQAGRQIGRLTDRQANG